MDPLAEISPNVSPYVYCLNNPVNMVDPDGRKERANDYDGKMDKGDWRKSDREDNTDVWKKANAHNLQQKKGSKEYVNIEQRAAFYSWYQGASDEKGNNTRWAGAAAKVASAINEMVNPKFIGMNVSLIADYLSFSSDEARAFANEGNEKIFEDAFPKLKNAFNGPQISGANGKLWDANMLSQEQNLIQPLYENTSAIGLLSAASKQLLIGSKFLAKIKGICKVS